MYVKRNVVMLPTEKAENCLILKQGVGNRVLAHHKQYFTQEYLKNIYAKSYHLYITSDDEIKEGDWIFKIQHSHTALFYVNSIELANDYNKNNNNYKKIIATTDSSLKIEIFGLGETAMCSLPQPSQSFIEVFIREYNKGNIITDIMVEYEEYQDAPYGAPVIKGRKPSVRLKVNPKDNTITIRKIKDSWNRGEIINLINKFEKDTFPNRYEGYGTEQEDINNWIEENL